MVIPPATQQAIRTAAPYLLASIGISFLAFLVRAFFSLEPAMLVSLVFAQLTGILVALLMASYFLERSEPQAPAGQ